MRNPKGRRAQKQELEERARAMDWPITHSLDIVWKQELTWLQRLQLIFGYNLKAQVRIGCQYSPGRVRHQQRFETTKELVILQEKPDYE